MSNETRTPEELLNEIWDVLKRFNILWMTNYLDCDPSIYNIWKHRNALPYRNVKKIVEYIEMHTDDCVTLCGHLMEYYKQEEKKRNEKIADRVEKNRERSRLRYAQSKQK